MLGLKVRDNVDLFPAGKSPPAQPLSYLNPNFNPSANPGKLLCSRSPNFALVAATVIALSVFY